MSSANSCRYALGQLKHFLVRHYRSEGPLFLRIEKVCPSQQALDIDAGLAKRAAPAFRRHIRGRLA